MGKGSQRAGLEGGADSPRERISGAVTATPSVNRGPKPPVISKWKKRERRRTGDGRDASTFHQEFQGGASMHVAVPEIGLHDGAKILPSFNFV